MATPEQLALYDGLTTLRTEADDLCKAIFAKLSKSKDFSTDVRDNAASMLSEASFADVAKIEEALEAVRGLAEAL